MKLIAYTRSEQPRIRPAVLERDWMDASPSRSAYRCLPLNIANCHGWEILCPARTRAVWSGGQAPADLTVESACKDQRPISHFGCGILTFPVGCLLRTEPGIDLWVTGPPNRPKHGIAPLTGVIEADWSPFSFTMNWRFTAPGEVVFEEGEPYCFFFPLSRALLEQTEPEFRCLSEDPSLEAELAAWEASRLMFLMGLRVGAREREQNWQGNYFRGVTPLGTSAPEDHRTRLRVPPFAKPKSAGL